LQKLVASEAARIPPVIKAANVKVEQPAPVIPGRAEGANPESRAKRRICFWIPGSALCAAPE
jgi:hypothetical protein